MEARYFCPCCGYLGLDEKPPGSYDICDVCNWEDDGLQSENPDYEGGANGSSLREWQHDFEKEIEKSGERPSEPRNPAWVKLDPPIYNPKNIKIDFLVGKDGTTINNA